ncbi:hypothetical protein [Saccharibacillus sp. JS10]|uniref:DUF7878 domain-containing protein n=1 Tax=Saccharibacillus sp. JS10 TaxID=2950552 RepID=UPI00210EA140|nr:hypothetical protein [Saccharibacillus sp. JS10]MCQ4085670.1 hypothetical protein [Saccharibacillus sp. JS10]
MMIHLSNEITFNFRLNAKLDKKMLQKQPKGKTLHDVDGNFQIYINQQIYFDEEEFLLLEFGILLNEWITKIDRGEKIDFIYHSIENEEPIMEFRYVDSGWEVASDWGNFEKHIYLSHSILLKAIRIFLNELNKSLKKNYELQLDMTR